MMAGLAQQLDAAEAEASRLRRLIAQAKCAEIGRCDMKQVGGCNAGCGERDCCCSVPVYECTRCGDSDYGDNAEADEIKAECAADRKPFATLTTLAVLDDLDHAYRLWQERPQ